MNSKLSKYQVDGLHRADITNNDGIQAQVVESVPGFCHVLTRHSGNENLECVARNVTFRRGLEIASQSMRMNEVGR